MWTHEDFTFDNLPNLIARAALLDGVIMFYQIYPAEGYKLHVASSDISIYPLVNGKYEYNQGVLSTEPYYSEGGALAYGPDGDANYDFTTNPLGFEAVLKEA